MGWSLIPLHDVAREDGACSCAAGIECRPAGKHPRNTAWQSGGWVTDVDVLASVVADRPGWNWGAVTGTPSGIWVLDVDPDNGGMESLAELVAVCGTSAYLGAHRVHRTGSGGLHLVYAIGDDGWMPRTGVGRIGPGLDVRAEGGQVVLPSSVSGKGEYVVERNLGVQVVGAMLRGQIERRLAPVAPVAREPRAIGTAGEQGAVTEGGERYARAVVDACLVEMRDAVVGTRNDTGFRTAVRIWELVLAPWCSLTEEDVLEDWWAAAGITGAPATELQGLWTRAYGRAVEGEGAVLPGSSVGGDDVPFVGSGAVPAPVADTAAMTVLEYREWQEANPEPAGGGMLSRLVWNDALDELKPLPYLIEDTLFQASDSWLIGASGGYKSFVALDWALHVATGKPWAGKRVRQGIVLYVAAEGAHGIAKRRRAWERTNGVTVGPREFAVLPEVVHAGDGRTVHEEWTELVTSVIADLKPALVVFDTQSRMTVGMDENSNSDMAFWAECVALASRATGACALVVHHTGRKGSAARGGSAIDAAQDVEWTVTKPDRLESGQQRTATLACTKSKDSDDQMRYGLELDVVELGEDDEGKAITSLGVRVMVEVAGEVVEGAAAGTMAGGLVSDVEPVLMGTSERLTLALWRLVHVKANHGDGWTWAEIRKAFVELPEVQRGPKGPRSAKSMDTEATDARTNLVALGLWLKSDQRERYRVGVIENGRWGQLTPSSSVPNWMPEDGWQVVPGAVGNPLPWLRDRLAESSLSVDS